jgi:hypothetical protein
MKILLIIIAMVVTHDAKDAQALLITNAQVVIQLHTIEY